MNVLSRIWFPAAVLAATAAGVFDLGHETVHSYRIPDITVSQDTVVYKKDAYKLNRNLNLEDITVVDTSSSPDAFTSDSLEIMESADTPMTLRDSLRAQLDSSQWHKIDSICLADSLSKLSEDARREYWKKQKELKRLAAADSLRKVKEEKKNIRDSIIAEKPRVLETYALPDSMQFKRIITWTLDQDFHKMDLHFPDTSYNYWFHDLPFHRNDVNATWLGVSGSPVQMYNVLKRKSGEGVDFYEALESWSYSAATLPHYNTKTPYTELSYWGTLFAGDKKESDNIHIFTTQNITPELNISLLYNRFGANGILDREKTVNKTTVVQSNYLGKKYTMHAGFIHNMVSREENGGIADNKWIRDTVVDAREIKVNLANAASRVKKNTFFLDQQMRIPFNFINQLKARKDTSFVFNADTLDRNMTTAFIGHSSELSFYTRKYTDVITDEDARQFYNNIFYYNPQSSADSMRVMRFDNKVFLRLQPWSSEAIVSKLDVGAGDYVKQYYDSTTVRPMKITQNSMYVYAGAEGQLRNNFFWNAKARYVMLGHDFGDFGIQADARLDLFPFRRARKSPVSLDMHFETSLQEPTYYQQFMSSNHFRWENDFGKISRTEASASLDIPRWRLSASAGYTLLGNNIFYDQYGIIRQNSQAMSILSGSIRKDLVFGPVHLENRALVQYSSKPEVVPVPLAAVNLRYYFQFIVARTEEQRPVLTMQIGADGYANTEWYAPAWNPGIGVFYNQNERRYTNGPYFDIFINMQWKRACIFVKYQNAGGGWPLDKADYFSADRYIVTSNGAESLKIGIFWPFYRQPVGKAPVINR